MSEFFFSSISALDNRYSIMVEDDERVAYAYMLKNNSIVGDIWLYNRFTQKETHWDSNKMPFINPDEYVNDHIKIAPLNNESDLRIQWEFIKEIIAAKIFIHGNLIAVLADGAKPGWSTCVRKDGPLAQIYPGKFPGNDEET